MNPSTHRSHSQLASILVLVLLFGIAPEIWAAPGDLDPSFGDNGMATTDFRGRAESGNAVTLDNVGRIIVAGHVFVATKMGRADIALARYQPDGKPDTTFGDRGKIIAGTAEDEEFAYAVAVDSEGRIVVAGWRTVARFNSDGSPDTTFNSDGLATVGFHANAMALDSLDRAVVGGYRGTAGFGIEYALARYNTDGSPDTTFDGDGIVTTDFGGSSAVYGVAVDQSDRVVAAGYRCDHTACDFAVARYNMDGSLDTTFDGDGKVSTDFVGQADYATAVTLDSAGRIIVAGYTPWPAPDFAVARYNPDGSLDTTFDGDGKVTLDFAGYADSAADAAVDQAGRIVVAGSAVTSGDLTDSVVVRYSTDGSLDMTFGDQGKVISGLAECRAAWNGVVVDGANRIVAAGRRTSMDWSQSLFIVARHLGDEPILPPLSGIDIKPGESPNIISLGARGAIQVAVLSSEDFDTPSQMVWSTLTFGHTGDERSLLTRSDGAAVCDVWDANADGQNDLVCRFLVKLAEFQIGDTEGALKGMTVTGEPFEGGDVISVVP